MQRRVAELVLGVDLGGIGSEDRGNLFNVALDRRVVDGCGKSKRGGGEPDQQKCGKSNSAEGKQRAQE
jgi:hypothetical protein